MGNIIQLMPVADLLDSRYFLIPSYQRGYRWDEKQVTDLLNDIYSFALKIKKVNEFYCLQPLVVKSNSWIDSNGVEKNGWELIDGQQRLTTLHLIISYLIKVHLRGGTLEDDYGKNLYHIQYQVRPDSEKLLDSLNFELNDDDNIDYFHIKNAYKYIEEWFTNDSKKIDEYYSRKTLPKETREKVLKTLVYDNSNSCSEGIVQVIWYEITEKAENEVDTFIRINMGKIPLTNAELIKALFLQNNNFDNTTAKFEQTKIASEWDRIEFSFQKDDFWYFLNENDDKISRIEFIFDLLYRSEIASDELKLDKDATFRFYNQKFEGKMGDVLYNTVKTEWDKIYGCFMTLEEWYEDGTLYHYIGFLIHCGVPILDLYNDYNTCLHKNKFESKLKNRIKDIFKSVSYKKIETIEIEESENDLIEGVEKKYVVDFDLNYDDDKKIIKRILLFLNIEQAASQHKEMKKHYEISREFSSYRFPFDVFKSEKWDVEHIDSYTSNALTDIKVQEEWLQITLADLHTKETNELFRLVADFGTENGKTFEELKSKIVEIAEEEKMMISKTI